MGTTDQLRLLLAFVDQQIGIRLQRVGAQRPAIFDHQLESAGHADARHRRCAEHADRGVADLLAQYSRRRRAMMASACSSGFCRSSNGLRITNIEPKFEPLAVSSSDRPATPVVCSTPGIAARDPVDALHDLFGALQRGRIGQLAVHQQPALVLLRNEAHRVPGEHPRRSGRAVRRTAARQSRRSAAASPRPTRRHSCRSGSSG